MSVRPRKPQQPESVKPRRKKERWPKGALAELNAYAEKLAAKARLDMMSGGEDNGPFLDSKGKLGGPFSIGWIDDASQPGTVLPSSSSSTTWFKGNNGWEQIPTASIIQAGQQQPQPDPPTPEPAAPDTPPIKKSKFGRMIKLAKKEDSES